MSLQPDEAATRIQAWRRGVHYRRVAGVAAAQVARRVRTRLFLSPSGAEYAPLSCLVGLFVRASGPIEGRVGCREPMYLRTEYCKEVNRFAASRSGSGDRSLLLDYLATKKKTRNGGGV